MKKYEVLKQFRDKQEGKLRKVGDEIELKDERAKEIDNKLKGFIKEIKEDKKDSKKKDKKKKGD